MARLDDSLLLSLIDRIYAAAVDASLWADLAKALGAAFRAQFSLVFCMHTRGVYQTMC
jgi:hypothetical protein